MDINMYMIRVRIQQIRLHLNVVNVVLQRQKRKLQFRKYIGRIVRSKVILTDGKMEDGIKK